jgi:16S rRNA (guanine527-N7)-methyltransferase
VKHSPDIHSALATACGDLVLPPGVLAACAVHWECVQRWNARTNLTAVTSAEDAAWLHYRDSLAALPLLTGGPIVDFGSGAGYPGIPLALARPDWLFTLVEPRRKRLSFLEMVVARLQLRNVRLRLGRIEDAPDEAYAHGVTRATFSQDGAFTAAARWLRAEGSLLAYRSDQARGAAQPVHRYSVREQPRCIEIWTFASVP